MYVYLCMSVSVCRLIQICTQNKYHIVGSVTIVLSVLYVSNVSNWKQCFDLKLIITLIIIIIRLIVEIITMIKKKCIVCGSVILDGEVSLVTYHCTLNVEQKYGSKARN